MLKENAIQIMAGLMLSALTGFTGWLFHGQVHLQAQEAVTVKELSHGEVEIANLWRFINVAQEIRVEDAREKADLRVQIKDVELQVKELENSILKEELKDLKDGKSHE